MWAWVGLSGLVHVGLAGAMLFLLSRPLGHDPGWVAAVELVPPESTVPDFVPQEPRPAQLPVSRLGHRSPFDRAAAETARSTSEGAAERARPAPTEAVVAGDETRALHARRYNHPTLDVPARQERRRRADREADAEEPTPFMVASPHTPPATLPPAPEGERMSRIPLEAALPGPQPTETGGPMADARASAHSPRRQGGRGALSSRRLPDLLDTARPSGTGAASGRGAGARAGRRGSPAGSDGRPLWLSTPDRRYVDYFRGIYAKVHPLWLFPKKLEILMEQGDVLVQFTILENGSIQDVRIRKSSGYHEFDKNVLAAIQKAAPFEPIPPRLGRRLTVLAPFEFSNPMVR